VISIFRAHNYGTLCFTIAFNIYLLTWFHGIVSLNCSLWIMEEKILCYRNNGIAIAEMNVYSVYGGLGKETAPICGLSKPLSPCSKFNCYCTPCALHFPIYVAVADIYLCILLLSQFWWQILLVVTYKPSVFWLGTMPNLLTRSGSSSLLLQQHIEHFTEAQ